MVKSKCSPRCVYITLSIFLVLGAIFFVAGFVLPIVIDKQLNAGLQNLLVVDSENAAGYNSWINNTQQNSVPFYQNFYIYNVTNADAVERGEEKPNIVELGPYSYRKYQVKFRVSFDNNGEQAKYKTYTYYVFNNETSNGKEDDLITTINIPFQAVRSALGTNWWQSLLFDAVASATNSSLFVTLKAKELCWGGYEYPILDLVAKLQPGTPTSFSLQPNATSLENADNTTLFDTFLTGKSKLQDVGQYIQYQEQTALTIWNSTECNEIQGTAGTSYHPNIKKSESLKTFVSDVFRTGEVVYQSTSVIQGITMFDFVLVATELMNATEFAPNAGFYMFSPTGVANLSAASNGAPVYVSKPHFLDADPSYRAAVDGMSPPDRSKHDTVLHVEPISGVTMSASKRLQVNIKMSDDILLYENFTAIYMPIAWIEETSTITPDLAKQFRSSVYTAVAIKEYSPYVGWSVGGAMMVAMVIGIVVFNRQQKKKKDRGILYSRINESDDE